MAKKCKRNLLWSIKINIFKQKYGRVIESLHAFYAKQSARDQRMLLILCFAVPIILIIAVMLSLHQKNKAVLAQYNNEYSHMVLMTSHATQLAQVQTTGRPLIDIVEQSAAQAGLTLSTAAQGDGIQAITISASFAIIANWLSTLTQQGVQITGLTMAQQTNGMVRVELDLNL